MTVIEALESLVKALKNGVGKDSLVHVNKLGEFTFFNSSTKDSEDIDPPFHCPLCGIHPNEKDCSKCWGWNGKECLMGGLITIDP